LIRESCRRGNEHILGASPRHRGLCMQGCSGDDCNVDGFC